MRQRILVTTAIEKTWDDNVENIFLGSWCKRFSRRKKWSLIKHKTIAYHWDDRIKLEKDYYYLNELYEEFEKAKGNQDKLNKLLYRLSKIKILVILCTGSNFTSMVFFNMHRYKYRCIFIDI